MSRTLRYETTTTRNGLKKENAVLKEKLQLK